MQRPRPSSDAPPATSPVLPADSDAQRLRMRDLVRDSGLPRQTIHFYFAQGLLPPPHKTGRNTAWYSAEHLERLRTIKELQERHFLPLKAIRAVLEDSTGEAGFSLEQEGVLRRMRSSLPGRLYEEATRDVPLARFVPARISRAEVRDLHRDRLIEIEGKGSEARVSGEDAEILDCLASMKEVPELRQRSAPVEMLPLYTQVMETLVASEARILASLFAASTGEEGAAFLEKALPIGERLILAVHRKKVQALLRRLAHPPQG